MGKKRILPQMFDVFPVDKTGVLDWKKIKNVGSGDDFEIEFDNQEQEQATLLKEELEKNIIFQKQQLELAKEDYLKKQQELQEQEALKEEILRAENERFLLLQEQMQRQEEQLLFQEELLRQDLLRSENEKIEKQKIAEMEENERIFEQLQRKVELKISQEQEKEEMLKRELELCGGYDISEERKMAEENEEKERKRQIRIQEKFDSGKIFWQDDKKKQKNKKFQFFKKSIASFDEKLNSFQLMIGTEKSRLAYSFISIILIVCVGVLGVSYIGKGMQVKGRVLGTSQEGYDDLQAAVKSVMGKNLQASSADFSDAYDKFSKASNDFDQMGSLLISASRFVPFASKLSSGKNAVEAGKHISSAGKALNEVAKEALFIKNPLAENNKNQISLLDSFKKTEKNIKIAQDELVIASENINLIKIDDLPKEKQAQFLDFKEKLPTMITLMKGITNNSNIFSEILGGNGPRKYLFLFQNNSEMRATGGFIGSYGLLDISQGKIRNFFIDGIFNPDGQLKENIVPPVPIQKISGAWSLHDSNWFADFPVSAREAINFYEKTGGPTADGVITLTPTVMQKLLAITGPIEMSDYGVTLTAENFIEKTQYEVEFNYDKQENKPKKILSDLAPILLDKVLNTTDPKILSKSIVAIADGLSEKHILLYSDNKDLQEIISAQGWSGEVLATGKDYLSVINTNINGYKTDSVIDEKISQNVKIQEDGTILDTVSITRKHRGGNASYEWWNKVNADYMRVYVPKGSQLKSVSGQTREEIIAPLDYGALGFKKDPLVQKEEDSVQIDEKSGTRVYEDAEKTVFGNWVYVSPGESVTVTYIYVLPFKLFKSATGEVLQIDSYSLINQKQSGSLGSELEVNIEYPNKYENRWNFPENIEKNIDGVSFKGKLNLDSYIGLAFEKKLQ